MSQQSIKVTLKGITGDSIILQGIEIYDLHLLIPLIDGRYDNFGCSIEINGYILNDKNLIIFNKWGFAGYYTTKEKISIQVEIVNGGKVLRAYKVTNAILEKYTEIEDEASGYGCYNLLFKFSKINLTNIETKEEKEEREKLEQKVKEQKKAEQEKRAMEKENLKKKEVEEKAKAEKIYNDAQKAINKERYETKNWNKFK